MPKLIPLACLIVLLIPATGASAIAAPDRPATRDGSHDFDFFHGRWLVHNRRLQQRLAGSHAWVSFDAKDDVTVLPGGMGAQEHYRTNHWPGYQAMGLQMYDKAAHRWALYWADNRNTPGRLQSPVFGVFTPAGGHFEADDTFNGRPIRVRVLWTHTDSNHAHWEQAFSPDGGATWETNWTMDFVRLPLQASPGPSVRASSEKHA